MAMARCEGIIFDSCFKALLADACRKAHRALLGPVSPSTPGAASRLRSKNASRRSSALRWWKSEVNRFLLPLPCDLPYALQRLCHTFPVLRPARALLARIPLGLRPWL